MTIFLGILRGLGIGLLVVLVIVLVLILLLLFVPFRYHLKEKGGSSETYRIEKTDPCADFKVSWLLHFLHADAETVYREKVLAIKASGRVLGVKVFGLDNKIPIPAPKIEEEEEKKAEETVTEEKKAEEAVTEEKKAEEAKAEEINKEEPDHRKQEVTEALKEFTHTLKDDETGAKFAKLKKHLGGILRNILPRNGKQRVWFGTGDPFQTAEILGVAAFFYPLYKNTIEIIPDMAGNSLYSEGEIKGKLFAGSVLYHAAVLYFDKDVKRLLHRIKEKKDGKL